MNDAWLKIRIPANELEELKRAAGKSEKSVSEYVRELLEKGEVRDEVVLDAANGNSGIQTADRKRPVRAAVGRVSDIAGTVSGDSVAAVHGGEGDFGKPPITLPRANVCVNCEHAKHKHGGFGTSCQFEGCLCAKFE